MVEYIVHNSLAVYVSHLCIYSNLKKTCLTYNSPYTSHGPFILPGLRMHCCGFIKVCADAWSTMSVDPVGSFANKVVHGNVKDGSSSIFFGHLKKFGENMD